MISEPNRMTVASWSPEESPGSLLVKPRAVVRNQLEWVGVLRRACRVWLGSSACPLLQASLLRFPFSCDCSCLKVVNWFHAFLRVGGGFLGSVLERESDTECGLRAQSATIRPVRPAGGVGEIAA